MQICLTSFTHFIIYASFKTLQSLPPLMLLFFKFIFMCLGVLHACLCTMCLSEAFGVRKGRLIPLRLELEMVVGHHLGAGNEPRFSGRTVSTAEPSFQSSIDVLYIRKKTLSKSIFFHFSKVRFLFCFLFRYIDMLPLIFEIDGYKGLQLSYLT